MHNSNGTRANHSPVAVDDPALLSVGGLPISPVLPTTAEYMQQRSSRMRRFQRLGVFILLIALLAESAWLAPFTDSAANAVPRQPDPIPLAEVQPYGVNTFLQKEVDSWKKDKTMQMAQDLGVGWIKQQFPWADIEYSPDPDPKIGYWDNKNSQSAWTKYDNIVNLAQQYGLRVVARIDSAPLWSHPDNPDPKAPPDANHMADFGDFVGTFVNRYKGSVAAIQVWNEPNLKGEWVTGNPVNAGEYTDLLKVAYTAAKKANPDVIVLAAPLATNNEKLTYAGNLNELDYLQGMYDAGAKAYFDAMSANAYGTTYAPEDPLHAISSISAASSFCTISWSRTATPTKRSGSTSMAGMPHLLISRTCHGAASQPNNRATTPYAVSSMPGRTGPGQECSLSGIYARSEIFPALPANTTSAW